MRRLGELAALDPTNARWREYLVVGQLDEVDREIWSNPAAARVAHAAAAASLAKFRSGAKETAWRVDLEGRLAQQSILLAQRAGDLGQARALAEKLAKDIAAAHGERAAQSNHARLSGFTQLAMGQPAAAAANLSPRRRSLPPASLDVLARAYMALGKRSEADAIVISLTKEGYQHPAFLAFWRSSPAGRNASS
jgi:hypothetical protein